MKKAKLDSYFPPLNSEKIQIGSFVKISTVGEVFWCIVKEINKDSYKVVIDNELVNTKKHGYKYKQEIKIILDNIEKISPPTPLSMLSIKKELTFEEAILAVKSGGKARMVDWDKNIKFITLIKTKESSKKWGGLTNQPYIAMFIKNGNLLIHPYIPSSYDMLGGVWEVI